MTLVGSDYGDFVVVRWNACDLVGEGLGVLEALIKCVGVKALAGGRVRADVPSVDGCGYFGVGCFPNDVG